MTITYGLTSTGFNRKDVVTIQDEIITDLKSKYGDNIKTTGDSVLGNFVGVFSEREAIIWEQMEAVYLSYWIQTATGQGLDYACARLGIYRYREQYSICSGVTFTNSSTSDIIIPAGSLAKQSSNNIIWETLSEVVVPASSTNTTDLQCTLVGDYSATIGSIDTSVTIIAGWSAVNNTVAAVQGRDMETDSELRIRAAEKLVISRGGVVAAIANRLLNEVDGVTYAEGTENKTDETDVNGLKPHSYKFVVIGGTDADIADKIMECGGAGIETNGTQSLTRYDAFNNPVVIKWDRATNVDIYLIVNITHTTAYPSNGDTLVKSYLVTYGDTLVNDDDVINHYLVGALNAIPGITALEILQAKTAVPTTTALIAIAANERAYIKTENITVNS